MLKLFICFLIPVSIVISSSNASAKVYKWVDEDGQVHFTNTPPPKKKITEVEVSDNNIDSGNSSNRYYGNSYKGRLAKMESKKRSEKYKRQSQERSRKYEESYRKANKSMCKSAKESYRRAREENKLNNPFTGSTYKLDNKEKRRRIKRAKENVSLYCK